MCSCQVPYETLSWRSCLFEALTFDQRNLSPGRDVSEVSCQPNSAWSQSRQVVTNEIRVDRKERAFSVGLQGETNRKLSPKNELVATPSSLRLQLCVLFHSTLPRQTGVGVRARGQQ